MEERFIHVLLIEDNPGDARLLQELLRDVNSVQFQLTQAHSLNQGSEVLDETPFDIVLLDLSLPDSQGLDTFVKLHQRSPAVPIVVITGLNDETLADRAMQEGAQDYLIKGQVTSDLLARSIRYAIERNRTEQRIREQAALLDIATDAILVRTLDGKILFWNKGAERLYGWDAETAIGQQVSELLYRTTHYQYAAAQQTLIEQGEWYGELEQITRSNETVTVESRWTLMRDNANQPKSVLIVSTNITEKKHLEAQFLRAQRMESIGTLASGIAHDLNNILTPILTTSQLLQMKLTNLDARSKQMLELIESNTRRGAALVKQVLSFARGAEGKHTILQIKHLIWEVEQIIQQTFPKSIEVQAQAPRDLWTVAGDATQLHQVLINLCVNARDAMPHGGILRISAENLVIDESYSRVNLDAKVGSYISIVVTDTGVGIPADILDRIFEPFFTTKAVGEGSGLGLSTVIGIVKSHGGFVNVASTVGEGTQFKVFLPAVNALDALEEEDATIPIGHGELVLLVDDEAAIRDIGETLLTSHYYRALTASEGIEAIALYAEHKTEISAVVIDMMMPTMDGATTIRTLRKIDPQVKIIAASGLTSSQELATASLGIQAFLPKPYTAKELLTTIHNVICNTSRK
ncbi:MAG TPA: response regulator [Microcoleaceae cyanobacterium]